jgi:HlyD family secretion protein
MMLRMVACAATRTGLVLVALALAGCDDAPRTARQGYVEGEFVNVASPIAGRLDRLSVARGDTVASGVPLFALEAQNEAAAQRQAAEQLRAAEAQLADLNVGKRPQELDVSRAQLEQSRAEEKKSATRLARDEAQFAIGGIAKQQLDDSRAAHDADAARVKQLESEVAVGELPGRTAQIRGQAAQVAAARAVLEQAQWRLDQKSIASTLAGRVHDTLYREGEWVAAGSPVVRLLPPGNVKVRFFVPQTEVGAIAPGRAASVHCDGCTADVPVTVTFVSTEAEFTPPIIYSNETRAKLVFMVEARPAPADAAKLRPGQPVSVTLK